MTARTFTLAELERMLADATEGPWRWHENRLCATAGPVIDHQSYEGMWFAQYAKEAGDRAMVASAPDLAQQLHAALAREAERDAEVAKLREALEGILECGIEWSARVDAHDIARAALSQIEAPKGDKPTA